MTELYKKYRPKQFKDIIGQDDAVNMLQEFLKSNSLPHALLFTGSSGCLRGDTVIYDPSDQSKIPIKERFEKGNSFRVISLSKGGKEVIGVALPPVRYPKAPMYRVETSLSSFYATPWHRVLAPMGYLSLKACYEYLQEFGEVPLWSTSELFQITQQQGVLHLKQTVRDSLNDYHASYHSYGEQPLSVSNNVQELFQQQVDVPAHIPRNYDGDVSNFESIHSHKHLLCDLLSNNHFFHRNLLSNEVLNSLNEQAFLMGGRRNPLFLRWGLCHALSHIEPLLIPCQKEKTPIWLSSDHSPQTKQNATTACSSIINIEQMKQEEVYYDFHVPIYNNYKAAGLFHHNCGKTTLARILQKKLGCSKQDYDEKNAASDRGIDTVRQIQSRMSLASLGGGCKIYYLDEAHQSTSHAQDCLLKLLEDTPDHVYFFLATTDPAKLKKTIKTRCTEIRVQPLPTKLMQKLLVDVLEKEDANVDEEVLERIIDVADGSPRKALVLLNQIYRLPTTEQQLEAVISSDSKRQGIDIARLLLQRGKWPEIASVLKEIEEEPETIRRIILGYANAVLLGNGYGAKRAYLIIETMRDPLYDCGKAGLTANCWTIATSK